MVYRVLANDGMHEAGVEVLTESGFGVDIHRRRLDELIKEIPQFDVLTVRSKTKVTREVIEAGSPINEGRLQLIGRAGVGAGNIDVVAANENGIPVCIAPHGNTNATAELAFGLMFGLARHIPQAHYELMKFEWNKKDFAGIELYNKTLGVIGCGRIGQRLSEMAINLGMNVIGNDNNLQEVRRNFPNSRIKYQPSLDDVLRYSDFVSIHTGGKIKIIGSEQMHVIKNGIYIVNCSRGENVDLGALCEALDSGKIAGYATDVHLNEPEEDGGFWTRLQDDKYKRKVILTPHLGASTPTAQRDTSIEMAEVIRDGIRDGEYRNAVNLVGKKDGGEETLYPLRIFNKDVPGAFEKINHVLKMYGINVRRIPSDRFQGESARVGTTYLLSEKPSAEAVEELEKLDIVYWARS